MLNQEYIDQYMENQIFERQLENIDGVHFMKEIGGKLAIFFNDVIGTINLNRKIEQLKQPFGKLYKMEMEDGQQDMEDNEVNSLHSQAQNEAKGTVSGNSSEKQLNSVKQIHKLSKLKENKLENKPKKPVSSFFIFYQQHSKQLAIKNNEVVGSKIAQLVANAWKGMTMEEKQPYYDKANQTKQKYREEMSQYIQVHGEQIEEIKQLKRIKNNRLRRIKRKKNREKDGNNEEGVDSESGEQDQEDSNSNEQGSSSIKIKGISQRQIKIQDRKKYSHRPKAPVSSFFIFYQQQARNIAQTHNETVGSKLAKLASNLWKKMSIEQRQRYEDKANRQRERYHIEMQQYKLNYPEQIESRRLKISHKMKRQNKLDGKFGGKRQYIKSQDKNKQNNSKEEKNQRSSSSSEAGSQDQDSQSDSYVSSQGEQGKIQQDSETIRQAVLLELANKKELPVKQKKVKSKKNNKDPAPHKPKGPICSFFQYYHKNVKQFMINQQGFKDAGSDFVRRASIKWKTLNQNQKQPYHEMAKVDRLRYITDMQNFKNNYPEQYAISIMIGKNKQQLKMKKRKQLKQKQAQKQMQVEKFIALERDKSSKASSEYDLDLQLPSV